MGISLYSSRVILELLGVDDFGIYAVVGGIVSFFTFLSATMASATQRFFSFSLGRDDLEKLKRIFSTNWIIYGIIAILALILAETLGLWFVTERLNVPVDRYNAVLWVYQLSLLTFLATVFSTPFMAIIIAHEDMYIYAYVSIFEAVLKLILLFLMVYLDWDKLKLYSLLVFVVSIINMAVYIFICLRKYAECQFRKVYWDKDLFLEVVRFTGWTLFGQLSSVARNHAVTVLINQTFNPVTVAARAIALNVANQISVFSNNFNIGLYPPIIKSYATNDKKELFSLVFGGSKVAFFLMWIFTLPMLLEMDFVLKLWLKTPPPEAILFTRLSLIEVLINSVSLPLITTARAPGKMKVYELSLGSIQMGIFVLCWIVLLLGAESYWVFIVGIIANVIMFLVRLVIVRRLVKLPLRRFVRQVLSPLAFVFLVSLTLSFAIQYLLPNTFFFSILLIGISILISTITMYFIGLDLSQREKLKKIITSKLKK